MGNGSSISSIRQTTGEMGGMVSGGTGVGAGLTQALNNGKSALSKAVGSFNSRK